MLSGLLNKGGYMDFSKYLNENLRSLGDYELEKSYDEFLDEVYPDCGVAGLSYSTSNVFKEIDPIAYRVYFSNWLDSEIEDGRLVEHDGEYYDKEEYESALEEFQALEEEDNNE